MAIKYPITDHYDGEKFYNEDRSVTVSKTLVDILKWAAAGTRKPWPEWVDDNEKPNFLLVPKLGEVAITYINHASSVVQFRGLTLLTDPLFSERASPFQFAGPKRHRAPGAKIKELPKIDVVVVSHNHYDHMDIAALKSINEKDRPVFIVPLGNKDLLTPHGLNKVVELDWWDSHAVGDVVITLVPMQHWSARGLRDRFKALWGGFAFTQGSLKVLFSGDTGYSTHFKRIADRIGALDVSLIPIGAYEPRWFMKDQHADPSEAVQAHQDLKSTLSLGIHFGTFQLTDEGIDEPVEALVRALANAGLRRDEFIAPKNGQTIHFKKSSARST